MNNYKFSYEYENVKSEENQYTQEELNPESGFTKAKYRKSYNGSMRGNPFIEALPLPRTEDQTIHDYNRPIIDYNFDEIMRLSKHEKYISLNSIKDFRAALPFQSSLEEHFYASMVNAYAKRKIMYQDDSNRKMYVGNEEKTQKYRTYGSNGSGTDGAFALIGYSGVGKTSSIEILTERYPQVIEHHTSNGDIIIQVPYLVVNCPPNSNFSGLFANIGNALDTALGNVDERYTDMLSANKNLAYKQNKIRSIIEAFSIGLIVIDEIQHMDFRATKESSFETLMEISNQTKVGFAVIGTEDAYDKMFSKARTGRRVGLTIPASDYIASDACFSYICDSLFSQRWFESQIENYSKIKMILHDYTKGIVAYLIDIYKYINMDMIDIEEENKNSSKSKKLYLTPNIVEKSIKKHFPNIERLLTNVEDPETEKQLMKMHEKKIEEFNNKIEQQKQEDMIDKMIKSQQSRKKPNIITKTSDRLSLIFTEFTTDHIREIVEKIVLAPGNGNASEETIMTLARDKLMNELANETDDNKKAKKKSKNRKIPSITPSEMEKMVTGE